MKKIYYFLVLTLSIFKVCNSQDLQQGLVAYYPFNGNANDESIYNNNGYVDGAVLTNDFFDINNRAYSFDGNNDAIIIGDNPNLYFNGDFTISALVYPLEQKTQEIIRKGSAVNGPNASPYQLAFSGVGDIIFRIKTTTDDQAVLVGGYELNTWQLLTAVREGNEMRLYVDGNLVGSNVITGTMVDESSPLIIGSRLQLPSSTVNGKIDDVRIYNRALSLDEIDILLPNVITGTVKYDINSDGCNTSTSVFSNMRIETVNGSESISTFSNSDGSYNLYCSQGDYMTSVTNLPQYYMASPQSATSSFTDVGNTEIVDFCIAPIGAINDLNIAIYPIFDDPRPGFNTLYTIVYKNVGTTQLSGDVTFEFDGTKLVFLNASEMVASQTANTLTFNFTDLNPFETRFINLEFNVFPPPTTNIDDILTTTATINPVSGDETEEDNVFELTQTVIGSYDPNDIRVLEGDEIAINEIDKYLHYIIRFQNTGTASAINVKVDHILDNKLDWTTIQLENLSHQGRVEIQNGNNVHFIFDNINLPDSTNDEPNSHGYIAFKIKPKNNVVIGDIINGVADIFFDFNPAITTNTVNTEIIAPLSTVEFEKNIISVYPNPTKNTIHIQSESPINNITIYDINGRLLNAKALSNTQTAYQIGIGDLDQGIYFVKIQTDSGIQTQKIIKE